MQDDSPRICVTVEGDVTVVEVTDRKLLDEMSISQIGTELESLVAKRPQPKMLMDFANVAHMSSSALGMLITLHKRIREKNGQLRLCNIQPNIYEVFVITRLNEIFKICQSRSEGMESLR